MANPSRSEALLQLGSTATHPCFMLNARDMQPCRRRDRAKASGEQQERILQDVRTARENGDVTHLEQAIVELMRAMACSRHRQQRLWLTTWRARNVARAMLGLEDEDRSHAMLLHSQHSGRHSPQEVVAATGDAVAADSTAVKTADCRDIDTSHVRVAECNDYEVHSSVNSTSIMDDNINYTITTSDTGTEKQGNDGKINESAPLPLSPLSATLEGDFHALCDDQGIDMRDLGDWENLIAEEWWGKERFAG